MNAASMCRARLPVESDKMYMTEFDAASTGFGFFAGLTLSGFPLIAFLIIVLLLLRCGGDALYWPGRR